MTGRLTDRRLADWLADQLNGRLADLEEVYVPKFVVG